MLNVCRQWPSLVRTHLLHWFRAAALYAAATAALADSPLFFAVINQHNPALTAQYWTPILDYVSRKSGVPLQLKMGRTAPETTAMTLRGEFDFVYSNHLFSPDRDRLGYRVIARPATPGISGMIVVPETSPVRTLADLRGLAVAFPSPEAMVAYRVPRAALRQAGVRVGEIFAGDQEGALQLLRTGAVAAAGLNSLVLRGYRQREGFKYRLLWISDSFLDIPIMAHPRLPKAQVEAVRHALVAMAADSEGGQILKASAALFRQKPPLGFVPADDRDYDDHRRLYPPASTPAPAPGNPEAR